MSTFNCQKYYNRDGDNGKIDSLDSELAEPTIQITAKSRLKHAAIVGQDNDARYSVV